MNSAAPIVLMCGMSGPLGAVAGRLIVQGPRAAGIMRDSGLQVRPTAQSGLDRLVHELWVGFGWHADEFRVPFDDEQQRVKDHFGGDAYPVTAVHIITSRPKIQDRITRTAMTIAAPM